MTNIPVKPSPSDYTAEEAFLLYWHPEREPRLIPGLSEKPTPNCVQFHLCDVFCLDETDPEWTGEDEIHLAAVCIDAAGRIEKVGQFKIGDFDDYDSVRYPGNGKILTHSLFYGAGWPQKLLMYLTLIEADMGGAEGTLNTLEDTLKKSFAAAKMSGYPPVQIASEVLDYISRLVFWGLQDYAPDDIFPPKMVSLTLPSPVAKWRVSNGGIVSYESISPKQSVIFDGHGGRYSLSYRWSTGMTM